MNEAAEFNTRSLVLLSDWGAGTLVLVALVALAVLALAWHNVRGQPGRRRGILVGLRAAAVLGLFAVFLEPGLRLENITQVRNHLAVLVDASRSMDLPGDGAETRLAAVQRFLAREATTLEAWRAPHSVNFYAVTDHARAVSRPEELTASGDATRLATGLADLAARHRPEDLAGVILFSDGADNGALGTFEGGKELPATVREAVLRLGAPIHTFFTGPDAPVKDVAITEVHYDEFAFVHNAVSIEADVAIQGYDELSLPVTLFRDDAQLGTRMLQVEKAPDGTARSHFKFDFVPDKTGKAIFTLEVGTAPGEQITVNNKRQFVVRIIRDKIRVLQVVGRPSWDQRFLRQLLKKNPNVDLISFFILRTNTNLSMASQSELSLIPFPTEELFKEQLGSFDLIVFQNFTYRGYNMDAYLPLIRDFVRNGGGFVMAGGDLSFTNGGYAGTAIEEFLPVVLRRDRAESTTSERFRPVLTEAGRRHPITALSVVPEENTQLWAGLPTLTGFNRVAGLKPGAVVLLETPTDDRAPVAVTHEFGEGRVLAVTTDSTWHWDLQAAEIGDNRHYYRFWGNAIRWLIKDPALQPVRVQADRDRYPLGVEATLTVRVAGRDSLPAADADVRLEVERVSLDSEGHQKVETAFRQDGKTNEQGEYIVRYAPPGDGGYRVRARATVGTGEGSDEDPFIVAADPIELRETRARRDTLQALADASGGSFHTLSDRLDGLRRNEPQVSRVNRRKDVPLWASGWWLLLVVLLPSAEWYLRRRWGLL